MFLAVGLFMVASPGVAAVWDVAPGEANLRQAIAQSAPGDVIRLAPGRHGPAVVDRPLTLEGPPEAIIDGGGQGSVLIVNAPGVTVRGITLTGSGLVEPDLDSGLLANKSAEGVVIEQTRVEGNLYGISIQGPPRAVVRGNRIANRTDLRLNDQGNGINIWDSTGSLFEDNVIVGGRDGLYLHTAHGNIIRRNHFTELRFAVHYMYGNNNEVRDNVSIGNSVGYALMYSNRLKVTGNLSLNDRDHGLMLHSSHHSEMSGNYVKATRDKCAFVYTSSRNAIHDNRFEGCDIGLHFTGGSEKNEMFGNAFVANHTQVKYSGMVYYEWSKDRRGNYWSDNAAFDLNGDGVADVAYRPNTLMDRVVWRYPLAKLLLSSPVMETLRFAQSQFPALNPGGVVDSWPLMAAPPLPVALPDPLPEPRSEPAA
ncbi:MAG: nitrous oxide reductase family maturation protein NosD [Magnetococcales bacterium]|nr:nitrous oxide reductase family maturation protein NosD [Magnetococcales bacterium]